MKSRQQQPFSAQIFLWIVISIGVSVWLKNVGFLFTSSGRAMWLETLLFGAAIILVSLKPVFITTPGQLLGHKRQLSLSLSDALTFLLLILYGPQPAIILGGIDGLVASYRTVKRWQSNIFTLATIALSISATARTYEWLMRYQNQEPYVGLQHSPYKLVLPLFLGATAYFIVNSLLVAVIIALRYRKSIWRQLIDNHLWTGVTYFPLAGVSIVAYACVQRFGWISVLATFPVLFVIYISYTQYNQKVEEKLHKIEEINGLNLMTVQALALAIDARSGSSAGHVERVKIYARGLAKYLRLSELETQALEAGAMLRDIGMLAIPDHILTKPGQLTSAEFERMKLHPTIGADILSQINFPYPVEPIVRHHHERWNGEGYPDGLAGEEIPLTARILAIADAFDAAREMRNYRLAMTLEQAVVWLREKSGSIFDPQIVNVFIEHLPEFEAEIVALVQKRQMVGEQGQQRDSKHFLGYEHSLAQISGVHREVVMLYELAQTVGRSLSLQETLSLLLERVGELVPANTSAVFLKDKTGENLFVAYAQGQHKEALQDGCIAVGQGNVGEVFAKRKPEFNVNPQADFLVLQVMTATSYKTSLTVPLVKGNEVLGVLALYSADFSTYSSEHIRLVEAVAQLAGDAIANALHYEETETTAYTDRLTGLPNLRAILRTFDSESERARRNGQPYTLLMMDLDGFKAINDTLGHDVGDLFLVEISKQIKSHLRGTDFLGRYAGDEFIAILPHTRATETHRTVERIKSAVDNFELQTEDGKQAQGGVSIGIAEWDSSIGSLKELMSKADVAMYRDKAERKRKKEAQKHSEALKQLSARRPA